MSTPIFQQLLSIIKEVEPDIDANDITSYDLLVDELFAEI